MLTCKRCDGKGYIWVVTNNENDDIDKDFCDTCEGKGYIEFEPSEAVEEANIEYRRYINGKNGKK